MDWQQLIVIGIVALAALYLARGYFGKKKGACGGCSGCPSTKAAPPQPEAPPQLVQLELTPRRRNGAGLGG